MLKIIEICGMSKTLPTGISLLREITLTLHKNEITGLLGPNGAGKTTLFSVLLGLMPHSEGKILFKNDSIDHLSPEQRITLGISYLPQEGSLFQELSAFENLGCLLEYRFHNLSKSIRREMIEKYLEDIGLESVAHKKVLLLSGGQKRRLEFARLLASNPQYVLLDEPFAGVDPRAIEDIQQHILTLKSHAIGILISDHNIAATLGICDRAHLMIDGAIIASGTPKELMKDSSLKERYFGNSVHLNF
jgi:lipopolysaccharide export system ATP-binding protein